MKNLKLSITLLMTLMVLAITLPANAQDNEDGKREKERKEMGEKIKASKIAFITQQMDLTPEEAEKFWPIYNEQEKKREEITSDLMERFRNPEEDKEISNEEAEEIMTQRFEQEAALINLKMDYHDKYLKILPATKVLKLYTAENNFKRQLMERMGKRGKEGARRSEGRSGAGGPDSKPHHQRKFGK